MRRLELAIFTTLFLTYAYFFQGGGWNQNSRFAQVRSLTEEGRLDINNYVVYVAEQKPDHSGRLLRVPLPSEISLRDIHLVANTGDIAAVEGGALFYPNKPPGMSFLAVPAYLLALSIERIFGLDPDEWSILTLNAYVSTVFSVSLIAATGAVIFFRTSQLLFKTCSLRKHALATLTFGLSTLMLPYATVMHDHGPAAVLLLVSFWRLLILRENAVTGARSFVTLFVAGFAAGMSVVINYTSGVVVGLLCIYALGRCRPRAMAVFFLLGILPAAFLLIWYHNTCFGVALTPVISYQSPIFKIQGLLLGGFRPPDPDIMWKLLFSSQTGLFYTCPVLLLAWLGMASMARCRDYRAEFLLALLSFGGLWLITASWSHWHGGWAFGPRFLIPALPFLSLTLTLTYHRIPWITLTLAVVTFLILLSATAVDIQIPRSIDNPLGNYVWPLLRGEELTISGKVIAGPVSANPVGVYESWFSKDFEPTSLRARWNSFNIGEYLWPYSLVSLIPLLCGLGFGLSCIWRWCGSTS